MERKLPYVKIHQKGRLMTDPVRKKVEPIVDIHGRITHWRCPNCSWTAPVSSEFTGMSPSPAILETFSEHCCSNHEKAAPSLSEARPE